MESRKIQPQRLKECIVDIADILLRIANVEDLDFFTQKAIYDTLEGYVKFEKEISFEEGEIKGGLEAELKAENINNINLKAKVQ